MRSDAHRVCATYESRAPIAATERELATAAGRHPDERGGTGCTQFVGWDCASLAEAKGLRALLRAVTTRVSVSKVPEEE